jgi:hypothetical protein
LTPFSPFSDKNGYAGFSPSRWYISKLYVEYMGFIKPYQDQAMSAISLTLARMDQSYKAIKYIARIQGVKIFGSLWTITNEFEQIRQMILTPTRHLTHIEKPLRGIMKSLHEHGHQPISLLWTDNVRADHQFVEQVIPTLRANVDPATTDGGRKYPVIALPDSLKIRLASSIQLIDQTCRSILADIEQQNTDSKIFVGFSVDWDWQASKSGHFPAALMVIAVADFVHLFQVCCSSPVAHRTLSNLPVDLSYFDSKVGSNSFKGLARIETSCESWISYRRNPRHSYIFVGALANNLE